MKPNIKNAEKKYKIQKAVISHGILKAYEIKRWG